MPVLTQSVKPFRWNVSPGLIDPKWLWAWRGLVFAAPILGPGDIFDYVDKVWMTREGATETVSNRGSAFGTFSADGIKVARPRLAGGPFTALVLASATSWIANKAAIVFLDSADEADSTNSLSIIYPHDTIGGNGPRVWWNGGDILNDNTGAGGIDGKIRAYALVSRSSTSHELFVDGISAGSSSTSRSLVGNEIRLGIWYNNTQAYHGKVAGGFAWNRALTQSELRLLALDPFGPFRMARRAGVVAVAAAAGYYYRLYGSGRHRP